MPAETLFVPYTLTYTHTHACTHTTYTSLSRALLLWLVLEESLQQLPAKLPGSSTSSLSRTVNTLLSGSAPTRPF